VPQELLHPAQVMAGFEEVCREGVPKQVGIDVAVDALAAGPVRDPGLNRSVTDSRATIADEQGRLIGAGEIGSRRLPPGKRCECLAAHRDDAVLVAFARDAHGPVVHVDVTAVEIGQFGEAQARGVKQFEYGPVTIHDGAVARNVQQPGHAVGIEIAGQPFLALWRGYRGHGILADVLLAHQVAKKSTRRGEAALNTPGAKALAEARCGIGPDMAIVEPAPTVNIGLLAIRCEYLEIATIVFAGQRRQTALEFKVPDEAINPAGITHVTVLSNASKRPR